MSGEKKRRRREAEAKARQQARVPHVHVGSVGQLLDVLATQPRDALVYGADHFDDGSGDVVVHKGGKALVHVHLTGF